MTSGSGLLLDAFSRIRDTVASVLDGLDSDQLTARVDPGANTIAWLVWHLTRVQDSSVADAAADEQLWLADGWVERFALPFDRRATGYGQSVEEVGQVGTDAATLLEYHDAVYRRTVGYLAGLDDEALDRVVDTRFDPAVTLAVRMISIIADELQHAGQAAYVRGVLERTESRNSVRR